MYRKLLKVIYRYLSHLIILTTLWELLPQFKDIESKSQRGWMAWQKAHIRCYQLVKNTDFTFYKKQRLSFKTTNSIHYSAQLYLFTKIHGTEKY